MGVDSGLPTFRGASGLWTGPAGLAHGLNPGAFEKDPAAAWAFVLNFVAACRGAEPHDGYRILSRWRSARWSAEGCSAFAATSNVDEHLQRSGWPAGDLWEVHGSMSLGQCLRFCHFGVFPIDAAIFEQDITGERRDIPRCPRCGGG